MTKTELEAKVNELELTLNSLELNAKTIKDDLREANKKLEDVNKPSITPYHLDQIRDAIEYTLDRFGLDDADNYSCDFEIDYDSRICLSTIDLENRDELAESLSDSIENIFKIAVIED